jgi:predicted dehydrogenase
MKKIRFGVVGTNYITDRVMAAGAMDPRFELTAVYSRTQQRADEFAARHGLAHTFTSLEEMASSPLIDAVYIASPNALHAPQAILCMRHGKHVLCEKPLASNAREVREMIETARQNGTALMEAMKPTLTPNFRVVTEYLPRLGKLRRWFSAFGKYSSHYDNLKDGKLPNAFNPELANGAVMDIGVYAIYPMAVLFGRPETVQATVVKLSSGVDGHGAVNYSYGDMVATTLYSKMADMFLPFEIEGEEGTLRGNAINSITKVEFRSRGGEWQDVTCPEHSGHDYSYEVAEFLDLIESGRIESEINSLDNSLITMEIMDEVRRQAGVVYPADGV